MFFLVIGHFNFEMTPHNRLGQNRQCRWLCYL